MLVRDYFVSASVISEYDFRLELQIRVKSGVGSEQIHLETFTILILFLPVFFLHAWSQYKKEG